MKKRYNNSNTIKALNWVHLEIYCFTQMITKYLAKFFRNRQLATMSLNNTEIDPKGYFSYKI